MSAPVDWTALAERLGTITWTEGGHSELGGTNVAHRALVELLGEQLILGAVEHYLNYRPGSELARSVLRELRPPVAMERCLEIYRTSSDPEGVRASIELLRWIADAQALEWYPAFMQHEDHMVRCSAVRLIDQLWMSDEIEPEDAISRLQIAKTDNAEVVRSNAERVIGMIEHAMALETARLDSEA